MDVNIVRGLAAAEDQIDRMCSCNGADVCRNCCPALPAPSISDGKASYWCCIWTIKRNFHQATDPSCRARCNTSNELRGALAKINIRVAKPAAIVDPTYIGATANVCCGLRLRLILGCVG